MLVLFFKFYFNMHVLTLFYFAWIALISQNCILVSFLFICLVFGMFIIIVVLFYFVLCWSILYMPELYSSIVSFYLLSLWYVRHDCSPVLFCFVLIYLAILTFGLGNRKCFFLVLSLTIQTQKTYIIVEHKKRKKNKTNVERACSNLVFSRFFANTGIFEDIERFKLVKRQTHITICLKRNFIIVCLSMSSTMMSFTAKWKMLTLNRCVKRYCRLVWFLLQPTKTENGAHFDRSMSSKMMLFSVNWKNA